MIEEFFKLENSRGNYTGEGTVYVCYPKNTDNTKKIPVLMALHGSGRSAESYLNIPFYQKQRDLALECGYLFAVVSNGQDTFGLENGYHNVKLLYDKLQQEYNVKNRVCLWGTSAGGLMMHHFFREMPGCVDALLGMFPIFNPFINPILDSLKKAFDIKNHYDLETRLQPYNPKNYPLKIYCDIDIAIAHGIEDTAVPIEHTRQLASQVLTYGGNIQVYEGPGGHSTNNFALYETPIFRNVLLKYSS